MWRGIEVESSVRGSISLHHRRSLGHRWRLSFGGAADHRSGPVLRSRFRLF